MSNSLTLLELSFALIFGRLLSRFMKAIKLNLPDVTAYLISGMLMGPFFLGRLDLGFTSLENVEYFGIIPEVALGFIAFSIGNEFRLHELKKIGKKATIIGIVQALVTTIIVDVVLLAIHFTTNLISLPCCIVLGAIASATAPAATLMVVRQYKAKGKITDLLLPIVALDDAVGLIIFAISYGIADAINSGALSIVSILVEPLIEILASLLLGFILGYVLSKLEDLFPELANKIIMGIAFVLLAISLSSNIYMLKGVKVGFSSLLVNMMMGTTLCNLNKKSSNIMEGVEEWTVVLYELFFIISGAELDLSVFKNISMILIGLTYIVSRCVGKYLGSYLSCKYTKCEDIVCKYLGITLFPQAGVALGMVNTAMALGPSAIIIRNVVLFAVMVYELIGPSLTKMSLAKAKEINA